MSDNNPQVNLPVRQILEEALGRKLVDGEGEQLNNCFHHEDHDHKSMSLNMQNGLWYCHAHNVGGNLISAIMMIKGIKYNEAVSYLEQRGVSKAQVVMRHTKKETKAEEDQEVPDGILSVYLKNLRNSRERIDVLNSKFGWKTATLDRFNIGFDTMNNRYTIPIKNAAGMVANVRMYSPEAKGIDKMISWKTGYGQARLFPLELIPQAQYVIICEGEKDCITMNQVLADNGLTEWVAITGTGGAGTWRDAWNEQLKGKHVLIIYDRDEAGENNAKTIARRLMFEAETIRIVTLDITEPKGADITNYFVDAAKDWSDLKRLIDDTDYYSLPVGKHKIQVDEDPEVYEVHLGEASLDQYLYKNLRFEAMIAGKDLAPFAVPERVRWECGQNNDPKVCAKCLLSQHGGKYTVTYKPDDHTLINHIAVSDSQRDITIKQEHGVVSKCRLVDQVIESYHNLEEVTIVPEIDFSVDEDFDWVSRTAYISGEPASANKSYLMEGTSLPHPRSQHIVHFIHSAHTGDDTLSSYSPTEYDIEKLKAFQPKPGQTLEDKFREIEEDLTHNVTRIWGREDLIRGIDLCYHSVLEFEFQNKHVNKAWGDILVIGDTRTGKSETVQGLIQHYRLGVMSVGENTSFAGLVGGLRQEAGKRWNIMWGLIPLNDRKLLVIDETSGLSLDVIGAMSGIRSNGIAEITKILTQKTMARTRLIWLSNPRSAKSMSGYAHGVDAVKELMGRPEDIARFDYVVTSATNEVDLSVIHSLNHRKVPHVYTSDLCHLLVMWAWTRRTENVRFEPDAVQQVLDRAMHQANSFASSGGVPLVEGGNHRLKIAKIAVAVACRVFSTTDGSTVIVKKEHVDFAADFLEMVYAKPSLDYTSFSQNILSKSNVSQQKIDDATEWIRNHGDWAELWLNEEYLRVDDFKTHFDMETKDVKADVFKPLAKMYMIERGRTGTYRKTPAFIKLIKHLKETEGLNTDDSFTPTSVPAGQLTDDNIPF